ncbi:hypothetical protein TRVL_03528 [Trypanosoma vivax]|nr:hypothetical protein TRVL_03528 [Trypanosoma vivax]
MVLSGRMENEAGQARTESRNRGLNFFGDERRREKGEEKSKRKTHEAQGESRRPTKNGPRTRAMASTEDEWLKHEGHGLRRRRWEGEARKGLGRLRKGQADTRWRGSTLKQRGQTGGTRRRTKQLGGGEGNERTAVRNFVRRRRKARRRKNTVRREKAHMDAVNRNTRRPERKRLQQGQTKFSAIENEGAQRRV